MFAARRELFEARIENARQMLELEALRKEVEGLRSTILVKEAAAETLRAQVDAMRERAHEAELRAEVFKDRLDLVANHLPANSGAPLNMNEGLEDAEYAFRAGLIDKAALEAELEAAGMLSSDIELISGDPRL